MCPILFALLIESVRFHIIGCSVLNVQPFLFDGDAV